MTVKAQCHYQGQLKHFLESDDQKKEHWKIFNQTLNDERYGFYHLSSESRYLKSCQDIFEQYQHITNFVQVGIGGSSLGPEMLIHALGDGKRRFEFINNIDPDRIYDQLQGLDPNKTLFYFVSKSGGTAETMAGFAIICQWLAQHEVSQANYPQHMVFATDPIKSDMLTLGQELGVTCLAVPSNVGGRFSVLSPVGLLPALFAGIDASQLLQGAEEVKKEIQHIDLEQNNFLNMANFLVSLEKQGFKQTVIMPYSSKLKEFSAWFVQLWAESLGKKLNKKGEQVNVGLTPIAAYGATDQHSQVQLFMEGPHDKVVLFLEIESFNHDYELTNEFTTPSLRKLSSFKLTNLMRAELVGTQKALADQGKPSVHMSVRQLNAKSLGALILYFESLTVLVGQLLDVDPFDQPGVEAGKKYAFEWLASL